MERYEVRVKYDEMIRLVKLGNYEEARGIANTIDWDRSKNLNMLCIAGEVFERCGYYEDSKAIYERAYQFQPRNRRIVYRLAELSIKLSDYEESVDYYNKYQELAPGDSNLLVLRYKIYRASGAAKEMLIRILQELKEQDYIERWAYELARLYAEAGMIDLCVQECDEMDRWFGNGKYVCKALRLKKRYQSLSQSQQHKLDESMNRSRLKDTKETIAQGEQAKEEQKEKTKEFMELRMHTLSAGERAREEAIDAARRAKAADLLQEALDEVLEEDEAEEKQQDQAVLKPTLPQEEKAASESELLVKPAEKHMPGVEFKISDEQPSTIVGKTGKEDPTDLIFEKPKTNKGQRKRKAIRPEEISAEAGASENDLLAQRLALALMGKLPEEPVEEPEPAEFEDDYIAKISKDTLVDETLEEEQEAFQDEEYHYDDALETADEGLDLFEEDTFSANKKDVGFLKSLLRGNENRQKKEKEVQLQPEEEPVVPQKPVYHSKYDTANIQKELAESIRVILETSELQEAEQVLNRVTQEIKLAKGTKEAAKDVPAGKTLVIAGGKASEKEIVQPEEVALPENLTENYDGQICLQMEEPVVEKQITGQIRLQDFLQEQALAEREADVQNVEATSTEGRKSEDAMMNKEEMQKLYTEAKDLMMEETPSKQSVAAMIAKLSMMLVELEKQEAAAETQTESVLEEAAEEATEEPMEEPTEEAGEAAPAAEPVEEVGEKEIPTVEANVEPAPATEEQALIDERKKAEKKRVAISEAQRNVMSYFMSFESVEKDIVKFLENKEDHREHLMITGVVGSGKTSLAIRLVKAVASDAVVGSKRIAKVTAQAMNGKPMKAVFAKVANGTLLIENAGQLTKEACESMLNLLDEYKGTLRVIFAGDKKELEQLMNEVPGLAEKFKYKFHLPMYTKDELVDFGKNYAYTKGYVIDEVAILAFYTKIAENKSKGNGVMLGDIKEILDHAIANAEDRRSKKLFGGIFGKSDEEEGCFVLKEADFE